MCASCEQHKRKEARDAGVASRSTSTATLAQNFSLQRRDSCCQMSDSDFLGVNSQTLEEILFRIVTLQEEILVANDINLQQSWDKKAVDDETCISSLRVAAENHAVTETTSNADIHARILLLLNEAYMRFVKAPP